MRYGLLLLLLVGCYSPMRHDTSKLEPRCARDCLDRNASCFAQAALSPSHMHANAAQEACDRATVQCLRACPPK